MTRRERASLKFIMDMDDDEPLPHIKTNDSPSSGANRNRDISSASAYANTEEQDQRQLPDPTRKQSTLGLYPQSTTAVSPSSSSSPALTSRPIPIAETSSSSVEDMNAMHRGYGGPGSGAAGGSSQPNRPMAPQPEPPVKLTPITGRVSRAKKGVPVHVCELCKPPKTFTRAEHLRRHQLSHQTPGYPCQYPGCDRAFYRADLLARHQTRHEQEGDKASSTSTKRRDSGPSSFDSPDGGLSTNHVSPGLPSSEYPTSYTPHPPQRSGVDPENYPPNSGGPPTPGEGSYVLSTSASHMPSGSPFTEFAAPRTPIYIVTEGLASASQHTGFDVPPGLHFDSSPWSNSGISTPSDGNGHFRSYSPNSDLPVNNFVYTPVSPVESYDTMVPVTTSFGSGWLSSSHHHTYNQVIDPSLSYDESLFDHSHPQSFTSVRSPTPPNVSSPVHSAESLVTLAPAIPDAQAMVSRHKDLAFSGTIYDPAFLTAFTLPRPTLNAIPAFLEIYWKRFDVLFPLVHRQSFEAAPNDVLRCAMAAVATQFLDGREDRAHGYVLHDIASQEVKRAPQWNVQIMQAILLCEFFARFRGRKGAVRPSERFQNLYSRVASPQVLDPTFASPTPATSPEGRWAEWIEAEARRRMLAACFTLDVHTTMYHQLPLTHRFNTPCPPIPLTAASNDLWAARSAEDWEAIGAAGWPNNEPSVLSDHTVSIEKLASAPPLDSAVYLASEALRLPRSDNPTSLDLSTTIDLSVTGRISNLFGGSPIANTYLALHYTPLHDLLAVSGESWLFARKITGPREYLQHQNMLKAWSGSTQSAAATKFAAKALVAFLDNGNDNDDNDNYKPDDSNTASYTPNQSSAKSSYLEWNKNDISDQWALYVNALICWAFGNPHSRATNNTAMAAPVTTSNPNTLAFEKASNAPKEIRKSEAIALEWLHTIADLPQVEDVLAMRGQRREALAVVAMVRRRLQAEAAIGDRSKLLVDSCTVLSKLEEAAARP